MPEKFSGGQTSNGNDIVIARDQLNGVGLTPETLKILLQQATGFHSDRSELNTLQNVGYWAGRAAGGFTSVARRAFESVVVVPSPREAVVIVSRNPFNGSSDYSLASLHHRFDEDRIPDEYISAFAGRWALKLPLLQEAALVDVITPHRVSIKSTIEPELVGLGQVTIQMNGLFITRRPVNIVRNYPDENGYLGGMSMVLDESIMRVVTDPLFIDQARRIVDLEGDGVRGSVDSAAKVTSITQKYIASYLARRMPRLMGEVPVNLALDIELPRRVQELIAAGAESQRALLMGAGRARAIQQYLLGAIQIPEVARFLQAVTARIENSSIHIGDPINADSIIESIRNNPELFDALLTRPEVLEFLRSKNIIN